MPQSIWTGSISFGLVNIPVKLYSAVSRRTVHFNQLDSRTNARIKQKRVSSDDGNEVPYEQIVKGYELGSGDYVVITDEELAALDPKAQRTIDIAEFVDLADIDPIFYDSAYYLAPNDADKPYALLARAMEESGKIGVARFVMRSKEYLAAVRPKDGMLLLSTMVYADEVRAPDEIPGLADLDEVEVSDKELEMARQLVDSLGAAFAPDKFHDNYREAVLELIDAKASGQDTVSAAVVDDEPDKVIDLMAALEASVAAAKQARGRHPTSHAGLESVESADGDEGDEVVVSRARKSAKRATAKKAPAKKAPAKKATAKGASARKAPAKKSAKKSPGATVTRIRKSA
jgi:DNA end-binding protein Ku